LGTLAGILAQEKPGSQDLDHSLGQLSASQNVPFGVDLAFAGLAHGYDLASGSRGGEGNTFSADTDHEASLGPIQLLGQERGPGHEDHYPQEEKNDFSFVPEENAEEVPQGPLRVAFHQDRFGHLIPSLGKSNFGPMFLMVGKRVVIRPKLLYPSQGQT
jgi:hypothetical protein